MKRCEDCGGRAGEHFSGKDCYTDEQERKRDEAREAARDAAPEGERSPEKQSAVAAPITGTAGEDGRGE